MEDYPRTLLEFERRFSSEESCREFLAALRWPDGFVCPGCQGGTCWAASLHSFVLESVESGSVVHTDGWDGYVGLEAQGYRHDVTVLRVGKNQPATCCLAFIG